MEVAIAEQWLYERLSGDAEIDVPIYREIAPTDAGPVVVIFDLNSLEDIANPFSERIYASLVYSVRVVGEIEVGSLIPEHLQTIADRIDALLDRQMADVADGTILACSREAPLCYSEQEGLRTYLHLGGLYRLDVQQTSA